MLVSFQGELTVLTHEQTNQLEQFEKALDAEYKSKKEAIRFMRQFLSGYVLPTNGILLQGISPFAIDSTAVLGNGLSTDLPPLDVDDGPTLIGKVSEVAEQFPNEKWTMRRMLAYLQRINFPIKNSKPEASISAALSKLAKAGRFTMVRPGAGKSQGIYQWNPNYVPTGKDTELVDEIEEGEAAEVQ